MHTDKIGTRTEAVVLSELAKAGYIVLVPFGVARYDLAFDSPDGIKTVQCKTGRLRKGIIVFNACSQDRDSNVRAHYRGQADYFGVWCPDIPDEAFLVPVSVVGIDRGWLRVEETRNNQASGVRWAREFKIGGH